LPRPRSGPRSASASTPNTPFESVAADGSLQGFDIELGNAICEKLQVKCTWVHNEFDGMIPALRARKFDAIMSSMAVTPARQKQIDFTNRLFLSPTSVIVRKSAGFGDTVESLKGKQVGVLQGSLQEAYARAVLARWAPRSRPTRPRTRTTPT
jgi:histidine transport system substrate-binding protein